MVVEVKSLLNHIQGSKQRPVNNDRPKLIYLTGHFDRLHFHAFQCDCRRLELKHETMMYRNKFLIVCFTVSVGVSMTSQKQISTELKSSWPVILTGDLSPVILSPNHICISVA
jgi:hypothetical protein